MFSRILNLACLAFLLLLSACGKKIEIGPNSILVGTIAGPETELMEVAKKVAKTKYDLDIKIIPFNDYVEPNRALNEGEINANMFQHKPYLAEAVTKQNLKIVSIGSLFIYPMGIYSYRYKKITEIPDKAVVAVPNDTSNQARSLLLLEKAGLISLKDKTMDNLANIGLNDIKSNPKQLKFQEVDPAFMVRMLSDIDLAVINTNYAAIANLLPNRDALVSEDKNSRYANILVVREQDKDQDKFKKLLQALRSEEVQKTAQKLFQGQALSAW